MLGGSEQYYNNSLWRATSVKVITQINMLDFNSFLYLIRIEEVWVRFVKGELKKAVSNLERIMRFVYVLYVLYVLFIVQVLYIPGPDST